MNKVVLTRIFVLFLTAISTLSAQQKDITLEEIWGGAFRTEGLDVLRSLNNGKEYSVLNSDSDAKESTIDVYDYKSGQKVRTLLSTSEINGVDNITSYEFNKDETMGLIVKKDETRDLFFTESGWVVIRLSERQVHLQRCAPDPRPLESSFEA